MGQQGFGFLKRCSQPEAVGFAGDNCCAREQKHSPLELGSISITGPDVYTEREKMTHVAE